MLFFELEGYAAVREGKWKLVRDYPFDWELYDMEIDRTELHNVIKKHPEQAKKMIDAYEGWAPSVGVISFDKIIDLELRKVPLPFRQLTHWFINKYVFCSRKWQKVIKRYEEEDNA